MCGIAGFWRSENTNADVLVENSRRMANSLAHRGPDDEGVWLSPAHGLGLAFRRLAILDLSPHGHQPMVSNSGRYQLVFNGEIYNYLDLRSELSQAGFSFRGHSDTETLLAAFEQMGINRTVQRLVGMYAFAVWDADEETLTLCRDRVGIKPLYYGWSGDTFLFGSELKAFWAHPGFHPEVDRDSLVAFTRFNYISAPQTIFKQIYQLQPGHMVVLRNPLQKDAAQIPYWSLVDYANNLPHQPQTSELEAIDCLNSLLLDSVKIHTLSDVPLGAFLSGGIDSSLVVAMMQQQINTPVRTFSIGFYESEYDEAGHARKVAEWLGTQHTEMYVSPVEALNIIPDLADIYDEPFADWSEIPTVLLSKLTSSQVTVSLSGDGGDELFAGYNHYIRLSRAYRRLDSVPLGLRRRLARNLGGLSESALVGWIDRLTLLARRSPDRKLPRQKVRDLVHYLPFESPEELYRWSVSFWREPGELVIGGQERPFANQTDIPQSLGFIRRMMLSDTLNYLPNDILVKVDRASMAFGLEARVPLLDHRILEFAWSLPVDYLIRNGKGKWILRQVLNRYLPVKIIDRPKQGFTLPLEQWLRGPLIDWAESLLDPRMIRQDGFFHAEAVQEKWLEHRHGQRNNLRTLWNVLMFQAWKTRWLDQPIAKSASQAINI